MDQPTSTRISLTEVFERCSRIENICSAWVNGEIASEEACKQLREIRSTKVSISEINGKPDDFDWDSFDTNLLARAERAKEKYLSAVKLADCTLEAIGQFEIHACSKRAKLLADSAEEMGDPLTNFTRYRFQVLESHRSALD